MQTTKKKCKDEDLPLLLAKGDLIQEILLWLPIVSLLRIKSVCKSWRDLIESCFFIDLHTETTFNNSSSSSSNKKFGSFILSATVERYSRTVFFGKPLREYALFLLSSESGSSGSVTRSGGSGAWWLNIDSYYILPVEEEDDQPDYDDQVFKVDGGGGGGGGSSNDEDQQLVFKLDNLGFPPRYKFPDDLSLPEIVGSCNGVVCLYDTYNYKDISLSLWNPATREFRILPKSPPPIATRGQQLRILPKSPPITIDDDYPDGEILAFGLNVKTIHEDCPDRLLAFGFDVKTKDYKVLLVTCFIPSLYYRPAAPVDCPCRVQVYSLSSNSWRLLEGITCLPGFPTYNAIRGQVVYLNGSCFFYGKILVH